MPAFCTHYLFCKEAEKIFKNNSDFKYIPSCAYIGAQGPDLFFFHRAIPILMFGKSKRNIGSVLHRTKPEKIFQAFADYLRENPSDYAWSYVCGFITHYALDRKCHPFVYAMEKQITDSNKYIHHNSAHNIVEMELDSYFLHLKMNIENSSCFKPELTFEHTKTDIDEISGILEYLVNEVTEYNVCKNDIKHAVQDTILAQKILRDPYNIFVSVSKVTESILAPAVKFFKFSSLFKPKGWKNNIKYANIEHSSWVFPSEPDKVRSESFEDLYNTSLADVESLSKDFKMLLVGKTTAKEMTENISFLG